MRNIQRINDLADFIERRTDLPFSMVIHDTCCLGFLAVQHGTGKHNGTETAVELLNITKEQVYDLFLRTSWCPGVMLEDITREQTVVMLREFAATGHYLPAPAPRGWDRVEG